MQKIKKKFISQLIFPICVSISFVTVTSYAQKNEKDIIPEYGVSGAVVFRNTFV
jgi:hypothetical protein